jgi:hypothetical protein
MLKHLFHSLRSGSTRNPQSTPGLGRRVSFRPRLEVLEGRDLPSTLTVTNLSDAGAPGDGSLRGEIAAALPGDTINFQPGLSGTIILTGGQLVINKSLNINGPLAGMVAVSGNNASRVFNFARGTTDSLAGLTIENGYVNSMAPGGMNGGGIANFGTLTVSGCTVANNFVRGMDLGFGGGIYNQGTLTVTNSTIVGNTAIGPPTLGGDGGGIMNDAGPLTLVQGRWVRIPTVVTITNSTITGNTADTGGGVSGGRINNGNTLNMRNTILAGNTDSNGYATDLTGNLTNSGCNLIGNSMGGHGFAATDLLNINPRLVPLQNNGGPTQTMALLPGSPAINAGDPNFSGLFYDQRGPGFARIVNGIIDIGAYEALSPFVITAPASLTAGTVFNLTLEATSSSGTVLTGYTGRVHFTSSDPQAVLPADYTFTAADAGVHTFSAALNTAGTQTLTAMDTTTASAATFSGMVVQPAPVSHFVVAAPATIATGGAFAITLTAFDRYHNVAPGYNGTVHFTSLDAAAVLPPDYTFQGNDNGAHTFRWVTLKSVGTETITATDTASSSVTGSAAVEVKPVLWVGDFPSPTSAGVAGSFTVTAVDGLGNIVPGYTGSVHFTTSDAQGVLPGDYAFTAADQGRHTFSATLKTAGTSWITATDTSTSLTAGTQTGITVNPASASLLTISAPASVAAGATFSVTVTALDPYNNIATGYAGTIHFTSTDPGAVLPVDYTFTAVDQGVHTFTGSALKTVGSQTIASTDTVNGSISGKAAVAVKPVLVVAGFPSPITAGVAGSLTVTAVDGFGNRVTSYSGTIHVTSSDYQAVLPADYTFTTADQGAHAFSATLKTAGSQSITATDSGTSLTSGTQSGITVNPAAANHFRITRYGFIYAGVAFRITVTALDPFNNVATGYTGTVHFRSTDSLASLLPDYTFTATDHGVHTFYSTNWVIFRTKGNQILTVTDTAGLFSGSLTVMVY